MNENWETVPLGQLCQIEIGKTPSRSNNKYWDAERVTTNVWLSIADLLNCENNMILDSKEYISSEGAKISKIVEAGTLLVSFKLTLGRLAFAGRDLFTNEAIAALKIKNEKRISKNFLYYFLSFFDWEAATEGDTKVKGKTLNKSKLSNINVQFPTSIFEQQRIVGVLDETFAAIDKARENVEKNLQNLRELFDSYLQSVLANPKEGWNEKTLKQVAITFGRGRSKHRPRNDKLLYGGKYPFIQTGDIRNSNHYITEYSQTYNETGLAQSKLWPKETICITIAANIAETGILSFDACFPDSVIGLVVNPQIADTDFVEYMLQSFKTRLQEKGKGFAQENINLGTFEKELFPIPPLLEQQHIVDRLNVFSTQIMELETVYQQKLASLDELKKSVLKKAFSGELTGAYNERSTNPGRTHRPKAY